MIKDGIYYVNDGELKLIKVQHGDVVLRHGYNTLLPSGSKHIGLIARSFTDLAVEKNALVRVRTWRNNDVMFSLVDYKEN